MVMPQDLLKGRYSLGIQKHYVFQYLIVIKKIDKPLRAVKYIIAIVMLILIPMLLTNKYGIALPYFCKWICPAGRLEGGIPLGAFYALFNNISFYKMTVDKDKCISCGICINKCKMQVDVINNINSTECKKSCPSKAIK